MHDKKTGPKCYVFWTSTMGEELRPMWSDVDNGGRIHILLELCKRHKWMALGAVHITMISLTGTLLRYKTTDAIQHSRIYCFINIHTFKYEYKCDIQIIKSTTIEIRKKYGRNTTCLFSGIMTKDKKIQQDIKTSKITGKKHSRSANFCQGGKYLAILQ